MEYNATVVYYRTYRLNTTRSIVTARESEVLYLPKIQVEEFNQDLEAYEGLYAIQLHSHMSTLLDSLTFNASSEASVVPYFSYYLRFETKYFYLHQMNMDDVGPGKFPHVVHALLGRFLT